MALSVRILCCVVTAFFVGLWFYEVSCQQNDFVPYDIADAEVELMGRNDIQIVRAKRAPGAEVTKKPLPEVKKALTKSPPVKADTTPTPVSKEVPKENGLTPVPPTFFNASDSSSSVPVDTVTGTEGILEEDLEKWVETENVTVPPGYENLTDSHEYYNTTFYSDPEVVRRLWTDLDSMPSEQVITHEMLSVSHRRAATVNLTFDFPFYGHPIRNITIATGGFLFTGYMLHVWLAATQFIAPLMANFETFSSNSSCIKYMDNGTALVVEWQQVVLQDNPTGGRYTFQAALHKNGDIIFVYKDLPVPVTEIMDKSHPVKVGISDAYTFDRIVFFLKRKTIYEYHRINRKSSMIKANTAIYFTALPTCLSLKTCTECRTAQLGWECLWCDALQRCSSGVDRHRQSWLENQCDLEEKKSPEMCSAVPTASTPRTSSTASADVATKSPPPVVTASAVDTWAEGGRAKSGREEVPTDTSPAPASDAGAARAASHSAAAGEEKAQGSSISSGSVVAIIMILLLIVAVAMWVLYAYRNPQTPAGQFLIKYRPSQWRLHGEARYTAATSVHI